MANVDLQTKTVKIIGNYEEKKSLDVFNPKGSGKTFVITNIIQKDSSIVNVSIFVRRQGVDLVVRGLDQYPITVDDSIVSPMTLISKQGQAFFLEEGDELIGTVGKSGATELKIKYFILY
jgi:hypothetical protein